MDRETLNRLLGGEHGGYVSYSTYSPNAAPVPGKKLNIVGVPGATVAPAPWGTQVAAQQQPQPTDTQGNTAQQSEAHGAQAKPGYIPFRTKPSKSRETLYKLGVPGATVYPKGVSHLEEKPQPTLTDNKVGLVTLPGNAEDNEQKSQQKTFGRHDRRPVDDTKGNPEEVKAIQDDLGLTARATATPANNMPTKRADQSPQRRYNNLDDIRRSIEELYPVESDADKAKREKLEKSQRIMAGIGDAFSAFKEAYDSARGKQVTPSKGNSRQLEDRLLALENVRKADRKSRIAALERLAQLQYQQDKGDWNVEYQKGQIDKWKQEAIDRKEKNDLQRYKLDIDSKYKDGLLDIKKEELEIKRQESEGKISHWQATERLQELRYRASIAPTTTTTSSTSTNAKGETTTRTSTSVRTKGVGGSTKSSSRSNKKAGGNTQNKKPINGVNWKKKK